MLKTGNQMQFQQNAQNLQKELEIFADKVSKITTIEKLSIHNDTFNELKTKIKNLNNIFSKIQLEVKLNMKNKNYNPSDLKDKLRKYQTVRQKISAKYSTIDNQMQSIKVRLLIQRKKSGDRQSDFASKEIQLRNMNKAQQLLNRYQNAGFDLKQTQNITAAWIPELHKQGGVIDEMREDAKQAQAELSMADQMMRIIKNRNLITKLLLIILIIFMGLADILLLIVKVIR